MMVEKRFVAHLIQLAANKSISERVRASAMAELRRNEVRLANFNDAAYNSAVAHRIYLVQTIKQFMADPGSVEITPAPKLPDGSPIGCGGTH